MRRRTNAKLTVLLVAATLFVFCQGQDTDMQEIIPDNPACFHDFMKEIVGIEMPSTSVRQTKTKALDLLGQPDSVSASGSLWRYDTVTEDTLKTHIYLYFGGIDHTENELEMVCLYIATPEYDDGWALTPNRWGIWAVEEIHGYYKWAKYLDYTHDYP